jgi:hypothetical protein
MLAFDRLVLTSEYTVRNVLKASASIISMCDLHITYQSLHKDISTDLQMGCSVPSAEREGRSVDIHERKNGLSLSHIYFNIPVITPQLHRSKATLQLSQNFRILAV